jgi:hypothetical protein
LYFDRLDKVFKKRKIKDVEHKHIFILAHMRFEVHKLYMVRSYANIEEMLTIAKDI